MHMTKSWWMMLKLEKILQWVLTLELGNRTMLEYLDSLNIGENMMTESLVSEFDGVFLITDWRAYLGPVINQGQCANCWAETWVQVMNGMLNKYLDASKRKEITGNEGLVQLSSRMLTECTDQKFYLNLNPEQ